MNDASNSQARRRRRTKSEAEIILICNPRAGGRWKELANIFDSEEAKHVRRIVTDSVEDIGPAIASLGHEAKLLCVYGGDGTIQRILDRLTPTKRETIQLAFLGGGTMNVTARWCGLNRSPGDNFREVVRAFISGNLQYKEVPLLEVKTAGALYRGFTFGMGPMIRLLDAYERGKKGKVAAVGTASRAVAAALTGFPSEYAKLLDEMPATVIVDDEELPYDTYSVLFANVTGQINPGVVPFVAERTRDSFHCAAYAVPSREIAINMPALMRGWLPINLRSLIRPDRIIRGIANRAPIKQSLPSDPRYVNKSADHIEVRTGPELWTIDGEIIQSNGEPIVVSMGPHVKLAVSSQPQLQDLPSVAKRYFGRS